jgi:hypothetical protein
MQFCREWGNWNGAEGDALAIKRTVGHLCQAFEFRKEKADQKLKSIAGNPTQISRLPGPMEIIQRDRYDKWPRNRGWTYESRRSASIWVRCWTAQHYQTDLRRREWEWKDRSTSESDETKQTLGPRREWEGEQER